VLVSTQRSLSLNTTKVVAAAKRHIPIVSQSFVLDSIQAGIVQPQQSYIIVEHLPSHVSQAVDSPSKKAKLAEVESDGDEAVPADDAATTKKKSHTKQALGKWRTARVFISSTFRDMHGERDYLTRYVFPELQDRCNKLRVHVHPVDLRWGVTEEDTANALELCLTEIDSCRPFFIGLLGDRYGWRPDRYIVPDEPRFDWVQAMPPGLSITHMEMFYGVLRDPARANYAFYIRDSSFLQNAPSEYIDDFKTESMEHKYNLERLKEDIRTKLDPSMVFDSYPCSWGGVVDGKPMTGALEAFGSHVLDTMWKQMQSQVRLVLFVIVPERTYPT
jgi:telomerase protein component 1